MASTRPPMQPTALVLYASTHGHTKKIASRIAGVLGEAGIETDLRDAAAVDAAVSRRLRRRRARRVRPRAARTRRSSSSSRELTTRCSTSIPTAFVSVSLTAADDTEEAARRHAPMIDEFLDDTGLIARGPEPSPAACSTASTTS